MAKTITRVEPWKARELLDHRKMNQAVQAIEDIRRDLASPTQIIQDGGPRRWFHVKNTAGRKIDGFAMVEITKVLSSELHNAVEHYEVTRPTEDSIIGKVMITDGRTILPGEFGLAAFAFRPMRVNYEGDDPELDDIRGTGEDSFELTEDQSGFIVLDVLDTKNKVALVREVAPGAVFFNDSVQVDSEQAGTTLYPDKSLRFKNEFFEGDSHKVTQLFLKSERPFNNVRSLVVPLDDRDQITQTATFGSIDGAGTFTADNNMSFALIKVPLEAAQDPANPFGLDKLTWNNSHRAIDGFTGTTALYADANNFERFSKSQLYGNSFGISNPQAFEVYTIAHQVRSVSYNFDDTDDKDQADNGPFFGIHLFWDPDTEGGAPDDTNGAAGAIEAALQSILAGNRNRSRVYIVANDATVMKGR